MLRQYLRIFDINFINELDKIVYNSCQQAKAIKIYNCIPQMQAKYLYQFIYINFVGPINSLRFEEKCYFFTFTNNFTRHIKMYIKNKKSNWF